MGKPLTFGKTDFTIGFAHPMFLIQCTTFVELYLQKMGDFTKNRISQWKIHNGRFLILGGWGGVDNFWTKVSKGTSLREMWSNK